ncbi:MAG TPA: hypothetical protein VN721_15385 [Flavipsychrobacter sp.]|nr:hypothetical protein [Flavipsychrobacter sp.]
MKKLILLVILTGLFKSSFAQVEMPFSFKSDDDNRLIKEEDSGSYYVATGDTTNIVFIGEDESIYRLFNIDNKLLCEGNFSTEGDRYLHEGKWTEYYTNGKIKTTGYYHKDNPVGLWQSFYSNGQLKRTCTYTLIENKGTYYCMTGLYQDYFENGQVRISGLYKAIIDENSRDTVYSEDPVTGKSIPKIDIGHRPWPQKFGMWEYYDEKGALVKKENF